MNDFSGERFQPDGHIESRLPNVSGQRLQEWLLPTRALGEIDFARDKQRVVRDLVLDPAYQVC
jgi:hypothetical protein